MNTFLEEGQKIEDVRGWTRLYAKMWDEGWVDGMAEREKLMRGGVG